MKVHHLALLSALLLAASSQGLEAAPAAGKQQQADALFAKWNMRRRGRDEGDGGS